MKLKDFKPMTISNVKPKYNKIRPRKVRTMNLDAVNALCNFKLNDAELKNVVDYISNKKNWKKMKVDAIRVYNLTNVVTNNGFKDTKGWKR